MAKNKKGFTLVELLAVIAILAIILLIAVPQILGVIDDAREDSFKNSVRSIFGAVELKNARENLTSGNIGDLDLSGTVFTGTWAIADGVITLTNACDANYCAAASDWTTGDKTLTSAQREAFKAVKKA